MLSLITTSAIVSIVIILGIFIFLSNPKNPANRYYALSIAFLATWMIVNFLENEPELIGYEMLPLLLRLDFALAIAYFFVWFAFCYSFTLKAFPSLEKYRVFSLLAFSTLLLASLSVFTDTILTNITFDNLIQFNDGPLWVVYAFHLTGTALGGLLLLLLGKREAKRTGQMTLVHQINIVIVGFTIAVGNALVIHLFLQPFFPINLEVSRYGMYGISIFVVLSSYAIAKYQLFDIKLTVIRAFGFFSLAIATILLCSYILTKSVSYLA